MKIFNWVHRKLHRNVDCYVISQTEDGFDHNTEALLDNVTLVDVPGLLSIGTFGFNPLKAFDELSENSIEEEEECAVMEEEKEDAEEEGELNPLVVKAYKRKFEKVLGSGSYPDSNVRKPSRLTAIDDTPSIRFLELTELKSDSDYSESDMKKKKKKKKKGERTTLADLFSADTEVPETSDSGYVQPESVKKPACRKKQGLSFAKKFLPRKKKESHPITILHQLMTRMLKRKIHPELEGRIYGIDGAINALKTEIGNRVLGEDVTYNSRDVAAIDESFSLLHDAVSAL